MVEEARLPIVDVVERRRARRAAAREGEDPPAWRLVVVVPAVRLPARDSDGIEGVEALPPIPSRIGRPRRRHRVPALQLDAEGVSAPAQ